MTDSNYAATHITDWWRKAVTSKGEASLTAMVQAALLIADGSVFPGIDFNPELDSVYFEYRTPNGRIDIAVFHADGSLTVIEAKDGAHGTASVLAGIGQVTMYALDVSFAPGRPKNIRKALLWNSVGDLDKDLKIELCCEEAGVIPMQFGPLEPQLANVRRFLGETHGA